MVTRRLLYALATSRRFERVVRGVRPFERAAYRSAQHYVAGTNLTDALAAIRRLRADGLAGSLDFFGESETDSDAVDEVVHSYERAAAAISSDDDVYLEVVPSHLGLDVSADFYRRQVERIVEVLPAGSRLHISAEESARTPAIIGATLTLAHDGAPVTQTLQANLLRSDQDAGRLIEAQVPVRLVKGAYVEEPTVARPWGETTDIAFMRLAHKIHAGGAGLAIGTHDPVIREALLAALSGVAIEMLLGVRHQDAVDLAAGGHQVRIYVPYGDDWFRYWMRRVAESKGA